MTRMACKGGARPRWDARLWKPLNGLGRSSCRSSVGRGLALGLLCLGAACTDDDPRPIGGIGDDLDADVTYDADVDFSQYQTFAFGADPEGRVATLSQQWQDDLEWVNDRVATELEEIGLTSTTMDQADVLVFALARTSGSERVEWACVPGFWGGYWYWGYGYDPCAWLDPVVVEADSTTVITGLVDPATQDVVFVGFIRGIEGTSAARRAQVAAATEWIFDRYPGEPDEGPEMDAGGPPMNGTDAGGGAGGSAGAGGMAGSVGTSGAGGMSGAAGIGGAGGMGGAAGASVDDAGLPPFALDAGVDAAFGAEP